MKIMNEDFGTNAIMLRRDGKAFPVDIHLYGCWSSSEDYDPMETLYAAEWLHDHTSNNRTKQRIYEFIHSWMEFSDIHSIKELCELITNTKFRFITQKFVQTNAVNIMQANVYDVDALNDAVYKFLNDEFVRARNGGVYNSSNDRKGEEVFRVTPSNFNWFNTIWEYVYNNKSTIRYVSICHDYESSGDEDFYKHKNTVFDRMPVDEFISISGNPVVEKLQSKVEIR